jgi:hypothetical protein
MLLTPSLLGVGAQQTRKIDESLATFSGHTFMVFLFHTEQSKSDIAVEAEDHELLTYEELFKCMAEHWELNPVSTFQHSQLWKVTKSKAEA